MPQHEIHFNIDDLLIGKKLVDVHQFMDILSNEGPNHRRLFHDDKTVMDVYQATNSLESAWSAYYHLVADRIVRDGPAPDEIPDNVRKESIIAELMDMMARGIVPIVVFPDSILTKLIGSIVNGNAVLVNPENMQPLKDVYYIKR
ncbi:MAG: hypothetical protein PHP89_05390 [Candidatus Omnitrophica bacterium]|nr:hypothetical protein [Candidatus Omnitrophota bacterium]